MDISALGSSSVPAKPTTREGSAPCPSGASTTVLSPTRSVSRRSARWAGSATTMVEQESWLAGPTSNWPVLQDIRCRLIRRNSVLSIIVFPSLSWGGSSVGWSSRYRREDLLEVVHGCL